MSTRTEELITEVVTGYTITAQGDTGAEVVYNHPNKLGPLIRKCMTVVGDGIVDRYNANAILLGHGENCRRHTSNDDTSMRVERGLSYGPVGYLRISKGAWSAFTGLSMEDAEELAAQLLALIDTNKNA